MSKRDQLIKARIAKGLPAESISDFIRDLRGWKTPTHLRSLMHELELGILGSERRVICSMPPRFGKTETSTMAIAWILRHRPQTRVLYVSYNLEIARSFTRKIRDACIEGGVDLRSDSKGVGTFNTAEGGGVHAAGIGSGITGRAGDIIVLDDYFKGHTDSESARSRDHVHNIWQSNIVTRMEPGCSVYVICTRWHVDDLAGRLLQSSDSWKTIINPALNPEGESLWPERWPAHKLLERRAEVGEYVWQALYQCTPYNRGGALFGEAKIAVPEGDRACVIGVDMAYTAKSRADYSVAVVMRTDGHIVDVLRKQCKITDFEVALEGLVQKYSPLSVHSIIGGTEQGIIDQFRRVRVETTRAVGDKYIRAQGYASAWNAGRIALAPGSWTDDFVREHVSFTGADGGGHDDQVDAAVSAFTALDAGRGPVVQSVLKRDFKKGERWT